MIFDSVNDTRNKAANLVASCVKVQIRWLWSLPIMSGGLDEFECILHIFGVAGDEAGTAFAGEVGPEPREHHGEAIAKADEEKYV